MNALEPLDTGLLIADLFNNPLACRSSLFSGSLLEAWDPYGIPRSFMRFAHQTARKNNTAYQSLLAYGPDRTSGLTAGLPRYTIQWPFTAVFPNHSYGLAGES
jgi:hypothetical protein